MRIVAKLGVRVYIPNSWVDASRDTGHDDDMITLTKIDGSGAFQLSAGIFASGKLPSVEPSDLRGLLDDFATSRQLTRLTEHVEGKSGGLLWCRRDYCTAEYFVRAWYISDSKSVGLATYVCNASLDRVHELHDCEQMVNSLQFV